ncbi:MAG TPA: TQO small subunit DoxD [Terracidiphilus sp.]|nr:TQO small subunit DoxD [Terracidiphilus sp.]
MTNSTSTHLSMPQKVSLVALRTLIGWHFLYEGYFKLILPAWAADGTHLGPWSAASYLNDATGPIGHLLQALFNTRYGHLIDIAVIAALCAIGLSLVLGLFTQMGCYGAIAMLALFYVTAIPLNGAPHTGMEGNYLIVNKNLIELAAVVVLLLFQTGRSAGLDLFYFTRRKKWRDAKPEAR